MRALVFGSAGMRNDQICMPYLNDKQAHIICCDGGAAHLRRLGVKPDRVIGDLDSAEPALVEAFKQSGAVVCVYPGEKDKTDMELCLDYALSLPGLEEIVIFGGLGGRLDHSLANIHLLLTAHTQNVRAWLIGDRDRVTLVGPPQNRGLFWPDPGELVSLLPYTGEVKGVTTEGLKYALTDATLRRNSSWGVSNEPLSPSVAVTARTGVLFVIFSREES